MDKVLRYFSFQGRVNRQRYWLTSLALAGIFIAALMLSPIPIVGPVLAAVAVVAALVASVALAFRRIHDRGRSAWWLLAMYLPSILLGAMGEVVNMSDPGAGAFFSLLSLPFSIWMFVDLGCLRGTRGPNRFGDDPLQPIEEVFA